MLVEHGLAHVRAGDGTDYTFRPSFGRIAALGAPHDIVRIYVGLHGPKAAQEAAYVLACLCDQEDASPLIGWHGEDRWHPGEMPTSAQLIYARHLMQHGMVGKATPGAGDGEFVSEFDAASYVSLARVHLGLSSGDAEALSMTEFQALFEIAFPQAGAKKRNVPSREQYDARVRELEGRGHG